MYTAAGRATDEELNARVPLSVGGGISTCISVWSRTGRRSCREIGGLGLAGSIATREECDQAGSKFWPRIFDWMLHVRPFERDPKDIWGQTN